jgi:TetR/AcrR family transcriptional repressor of nem operon
MSKPSLREDLLNAGLKVMFRAGYTGASVRDICEAAEVPLGSFTNHFRSKEAFAEEVLDRYFAHLKGFVKEALDDKSLNPGSDCSGIWTLLVVCLQTTNGIAVA